MNLIVFDLDGTLTGTNEVDTDCFVQALGDALGIDHVNTNWEQYEHATDLGCVQGIGGADRSEKLRRAGATHTVENFLDQHRLYDRSRRPVSLGKPSVPGKVS